MVRSRPPGRPAGWGDLGLPRYRGSTLAKLKSWTPPESKRSLGNADSSSPVSLLPNRPPRLPTSTAGWRKPVNELYPGDRIIELAIQKGISFTTASDAHSHAQLGDNFPSLARKMATFGILQVCIFEKHRRTQLHL